MALRMNYAEVSFKNELKSSGTNSNFPADPKENIILHKSNFGFSKILLTMLLTLFLLKEILLSVSFIRKVWSYCPKNWKSVSSSCYFISTDAKSWNESQENCSRMEAHLVVINSKEEQDFITWNTDKMAAFYVGLSDLEGQGHWQWVDQTPYNQIVKLWHPSEPTHGQEHCVIVNYHAQWGWNIVCAYVQRSVCEMMKIYL